MLCLIRFSHAQYIRTYITVAKRLLQYDELEPKPFKRSYISSSSGVSRLLSETWNYPHGRNLDDIQSVLSCACEELRYFTGRDGHHPLAVPARL